MQLINFNIPFSFVTIFLNVSTDSEGLTLINSAKVTVSLTKIKNGFRWELPSDDHFVQFHFVTRYTLIILTPCKLAIECSLTIRNIMRLLNIDHIAPLFLIIKHHNINSPPIMLSFGENFTFVPFIIFKT